MINILIIIAVLALLIWLFIAGHYVIFTLLALVVFGIGYLLVYCFAAATELGMRDRYPFDYLMRIGWVMQKFEIAGYTRGEYIAPGTDFPGVYMKKGDIVLSIILKADTYPYKIVCIDSNNTELLAMDSEKTEETEQIIDNFLKTTPR